MNKEPLSSTIERTLSILEIFIQNPEGLNPQEILDKIQISRSTLFSLLKELKDIGYLDQTESRGRYIAGPRLLSWSGTNSPSYQTLITVFQQELHNKDLAETIALVVPAPQGVLVLDQKEGSQIIRAVYSIGEPLTGVSAAQKILNSPYSEEILESGYAFNGTSDFSELAVPVCADGVKPVAGIILNVPNYRWKKEKLLQDWLTELRAMAARISYRLGALQYTPYHQSLQASIQPTQLMSDQQISQFLTGPWTARLACIRPDGHPHVIPVWQEWDGKKFSILAWQGSQWVDYVRKNNQVSLTVDEPWSPYRRIVMRGLLKEEKNINSQLQSELLTRLSNRYLGQNTPQHFFNQVETIFTIIPESMRGWMGLSSDRN